MVPQVRSVLPEAPHFTAIYMGANGEKPPEIHAHFLKISENGIFVNLKNACYPPFVTMTAAPSFTQTYVKLKCGKSACDQQKN